MGTWTNPRTGAPFTEAELHESVPFTRDTARGIMKIIAKAVRELRADLLQRIVGFEEKSDALAVTTARIAALETRCIELETRLAASDRRHVESDRRHVDSEKSCAANRRHAENLERKIGESRQR